MPKERKKVKDKIGGMSNLLRMVYKTREACRYLRAQ